MYLISSRATLRGGERERGVSQREIPTKTQARGAAAGAGRGEGYRRASSSSEWSAAASASRFRLRKFFRMVGRSLDWFPGEVWVGFVDGGVAGGEFADGGEMGILDRFGSNFFFPQIGTNSPPPPPTQGSGPGRAVGMNPVHWRTVEPGLDRLVRFFAAIWVQKDSGRTRVGCFEFPAVQQPSSLNQNFRSVSTVQSWNSKRSLRN